MICPSVASLMPSARISLRAAKHTFASIGVRPCVPLHASRMLYGTVPGLGASTHVCRGPPRSHFRPFSTEDELELSSVLMTRPRHVARHIRQSMLGSSRRIARFRSSVTYLMIVLQSRLQRKECAPHEASLIMENLMKECVDLRQGDMAHLLFRASIRFRKYGMKVGMPLVKSLYDSYRIDNAKELMKNLAEELKNNIEETELAIIAVLAYEFSGQHNHALELLKKIPQSKLSTSDVCSIIEGFGMGAHYDDVCMITEELLKEENKVESSDLSAIVSSAVCATIGNQEHMNKMVECAMRRGIRLSEQAASTLLRIALEEAKPTTVSEVYDVESGLCKRLGVDNLGTASETSVIAKCTELLHKSHESGDDIMLCKVQHLAQVVDNAMDNDQLDDIDPVYIVSMIKGFGVLGRFEEMKSSFVKLKKCGGVKDHRLYDEMLKWYAHSYNVKEVIALKEEMTAENVYHTPFTYHNVFRVLDKYYPRMVEKYVKEMRGRGIALEGFMYPTLMRVFMELKDYETVDNLYREARSRGQQGLGPSFTPGIVIQALRCYQHDLDKCRGIIEDADKRGFLAHEAVQAEILQLYASNERYEELGRLLTRIPNKSSSIYRVLLRDATKRRDRKEFDKLLNEVMSQHVELNERLFSVIITSLGFFKDAEGVNKFIAMARSSEQIRSPMFFSDAAGAFARLGHLPAVDQCWKDLLQSHMAITMPVYNRFLDIYMNHNNVVMVQEILDTMMKLVPPNPVTATTVVDMLGKMGRLSEMEAVLSEMSKSTNASPTLVTYHQAMNAYAKCGDVVKMEQMRERLQREGFVENNVTYNILFEGYGRAKRFEHLAELLQQRKERGIAMDEFGYVILLNTYARARLTSEAEAIVDEMVTSGINFTCRMMATVANAFSAVGNVEQMERYIRLLLAHPECRLREVESVYSIYSRQRDTVKLQELLDTKTLSKSEFIFNICVAAFARAGEHTKVAFLLHEMEQKGYSLSRNTSVILSTLLLKAGKVELANSVLKWKGVQPEQVETPEDGRSLDEDSLPLTSEECLQQQMESSIPSTHKGEDDGIKMD